MKKLFLFLAMASTTMFVSCGSDDSDGGSEPQATSITLSSTLTAIEVGQSVTLTVTDNLTNDVTSSSTFTANGVALTGNTFTPGAAGTFSIVAKNGTLTSAPITVTVTVPAAGKYTFDGDVYEVDNMFFRVHGADGAITVLDFAAEGEPADYRTLWVGVAYNGPEADIATATHYYEYMFTIPALYDGTEFTVQFPGEADASPYSVYADYDQEPFDLSLVDGGTITFNEFLFDETSASSDNASEFTAGTSAIISHEFNADLTSEDIVAVGLANLLGSSRSATHNKSFPANMIKMNDLKKATTASKVKVQSFKVNR